MPRPVFVFLLFPFLFPALLPAQDSLSIDTTRRCIYTGRYFGSPLYQFSPSATVDTMVQRICAYNGLQCNFQIINTYPVQTVATVLQDSTYFLLYNREYFYKHRADSVALYALLAHEIGHIIHRHALDGQWRILEETEADEFAGRAMVHLPLHNIEGPEAVLRRLDPGTFSYDAADHTFVEALVPAVARRHAFQDSWFRELATTKGDALNPENADFDTASTPWFRFHSACSINNFVLPDSIFKNCEYLRNVDSVLHQALVSTGYFRFSYLGAPKGFALITGVEQFLEDGYPAAGEIRWLDYPQSARLDDVFDFICQYLGRLTMPHPARLRVLVFLVSDSGPDRSGWTKADKQHVTEWMDGRSWLPQNIGAARYTGSDIKINAVVFEFRRPQSTDGYKEECSARLQAIKHLRSTGILAALGIKTP